MLRKPSSIIILSLLVISALALAFNVQPVKSDYAWTGPIYIRADGSISPPTAPISSVDNVTYTLTDNITGDFPAYTSAIIIRRDNIIIDGAGHTLQGTKADYSKGIELTGRSNVTIRNMEITTVFYGIWLDFSNNCSISGNNVANSWFGVWLSSSSNDSVNGNNITANVYYGIGLGPSSNNNSVSGNNLTNNMFGINLASSINNSVSRNSFVNNGLVVDGSPGNVVTDNLVNGKPIVYLKDVSDYSVGDAGQVILVDCNNMTVENLDLSSTTIGVELWATNNTVISGNNITANSYEGIYLDSSSSNNSVNGNNITDNTEGIWLGSSSDNSLNGNNITANGDTGLWLVDSSNNNSVNGNNITNNGHGIDLYSSYDNSVNGNNITDNWYGIIFYSSSNNSLSRNNIANNGWGIDLDSSSSNTFYLNNFMNNTVRQVYSSDSNNAWDNGYPSGGNYWSDYVGTDVNSGPGQNLPGSDGIGDTPYIIDASSTDHYPLMNPWTPQPIVTASLDVEPHTLNLKSKSEWVTAYVELPEGYNVTEIVVSTIRLNETIPAELKLTAIGDYDKDTIPDLMVKFNRTAVSEFILSEGLMTGNVTLTVTGNLMDRTPFQGSTVITVRMPGDVNADGKVDGKDIALAAMAFGSCPGYPRWNGAADENEDNKIDGKDIVLIALNFGKTYP